MIQLSSEIVGLINRTRDSIPTNYRGRVEDLVNMLIREHRRYEYLRKLNPRQFSDLYQRALTAKRGFDACVDEQTGNT